MAAESGSPKPQPTGIMRALVVVARDEPQLWQSLTEHFSANEDVRVLLERRQGERRQRVQTYGADRRESDRRRPPSIQSDAGHRQYVIARPQH